MRARLFSMAGLLTASAALAHGGFYSQLDWSGGGGVQGPGISFGTTFYTSTGINWDGLPGYIVLGVNATRFAITDNLTGCQYAFPVDLDLDGDLDVVAETWSSPYKVMWYENDGTGYGWEEHYISSNYPLVMCAFPGDVDYDGDIDVVGANSISGIEWWRNEDGVGETWTRFQIDDSYEGPDFVCCADMDSDSLLEVVAPSDSDPYEVAWWEPATTPTDSVWEKTLISDYSYDGRELFAVDLDQDGDMDALVAHYYGPHGIKFYENIDGIGTEWEELELTETYHASSVHAADLDSDGDMDVVGCGGSGDNITYLWAFENDGNCDTWTIHTIDTEVLESWLPEGVHAVDVTGDSLPDIVCVEAVYAHEVAVYRNVYGSIDMFAKNIIAGGTSWYIDADEGDFNGDGKTDVLIASSSGIEVSWFEVSSPTQGSLTSSILDAQGWPEWDSIEWEAVEPPGTSLTFQVRGSGDPDDMGAWSDTIHTSGSLEGYLDSTYRFIQYRVNLQAEPGTPSPYLEQMLVHFSNMGLEEGEGGEPLSLSVTPNPFAELALVSVTGPSAETVVSVYDISGRLIQELSPNATGAYEWNGLDESGHAVPAGSYLVRAVRGDEVAQAQLIRL
jgi:hypothetical protein